MRRPMAVWLLVGAAASWALATVMSKVTLEELAPVDLLTVEVMVGAAAVWSAAWLRGATIWAVAPWAYAALGLLEPALTFALFDLGIDRTGAADAAVLIASDGLFSVALAWLVLRERATGRIAVAVSLGFAGAALVGLTGSPGRTSIGGDALVLASSAAAALYGVGARRIAIRGDGDPLTATAWQLGAATVATAPLLAVTALGGHSRLGSADAAHLLAAIATGLLGSAIPLLLYNAAISQLRVSVTVVILNLIPVLGAGLAVVLLGERLSPLQFVGAAAVVGAAFGIRGNSDTAPGTT